MFNKHNNYSIILHIILDSNRDHNNGICSIEIELEAIEIIDIYRNMYND